MRPADEYEKRILFFFFQILDERRHRRLVVEVAVKADGEEAVFHLLDGFERVRGDACVRVRFKTVGVELRRERENPQVPDHFESPPRDQPLCVDEKDERGGVHGFR